MLLHRNHGCQAPWRPAQVASLLVWFGTIAGFYALFVPVLPSVAWRATAIVLYTVTTAGTFLCYFVVSLTDPADNTADGPLYCEYCQTFVQRGSRHCKECQKCVLGFDHHCKWVNNCIGAKNYTPFMALLTSMCAMLAVQLAAGVQLLVLCFMPAQQQPPAWLITPALQEAYPVPISREAYIAALCLYMAVAVLALYGLGDLWLLHLVLMARGLTTYDYIMANHDAAVSAAAAAAAGASSSGALGQQPASPSSVLAASWRKMRSLGPRSNQVQDESLLTAAAQGRGADHAQGGSTSGSGSRAGDLSFLPGGAISPRVSAGSSSRGAAAAASGLLPGSSPGNGSGSGGGGRISLLATPNRKHRVSLTPCQACMTPQSAIDARQHAVAYQQASRPQCPQGGSPPKKQPVSMLGSPGAEKSGTAAAAAAVGESGAGSGAALFDAAAPGLGWQAQQQQQGGSLDGTTAPPPSLKELAAVQQGSNKHLAKPLLAEGRRPSVKFAAEL